MVAAQENKAGRSYAAMVQVEKPNVFVAPWTTRNWYISPTDFCTHNERNICTIPLNNFASNSNHGLQLNGAEPRDASRSNSGGFMFLKKSEWTKRKTWRRAMSRPIMWVPPSLW